MLTKSQALSLRHGQTLHSVTRKNADGTPMRVRVNGKVKTWVRNPDAFQIPVKHGLYAYGYVTEQNAAEWELSETYTGRNALDVAALDKLTVI